MVILIIDSAIEIIERLEEIVAETKSIRAIHTAISYEKAIILYKDHQPDVVLLDINLQENDSVQLLKLIKTTGSNSSVIMIYNQEDPYKEEKCRLLGADFFCDLYHDYEKIPGVIDTIAANKKGYR